MDTAFRADRQRDRLDTRDLPFGVALTAEGQLTLLDHPENTPLHALIEDVEARLLSLRPVLRACARCVQMEVSVGGQRVHALRVQLEHAEGPPLDAWRPRADEGAWWVEAGIPFVWPVAGGLRPRARRA